MDKIYKKIGAVLAELPALLNFPEWKRASGFLSHRALRDHGENNLKFSIQKTLNLP